MENPENSSTATSPETSPEAQVKKQSRGRPVLRKFTTMCREYKIWHGMHTRCYNQKMPSWESYGGRGITVCDRWNRKISGGVGFQNFMEDMGQRPSKRHSVERLDNDAGYSPENCKWATWEVQATNRRAPRWGPPIDPTSLRQRAIAAGLPYMLVYLRVHNLGWDEARALATPKQKRGRPATRIITTPKRPRGRPLGWRKYPENKTVQIVEK